MRQATIYAVCGAHGDVRYVGQSVNLSQRKHSGYTGRVGEWMKVNPWSYLELEVVGLDEAPTAEEWWLAYLRSIGCDLLNIRNPHRSQARPEPPVASNWTEDDYRAAGVTQRKLRLRLEDSEALDALAETEGCGISEWVARRVRAERGSQQQQAALTSPE
jgi:hypothetical protein